jgi:hypothetical protein
MQLSSFNPENELEYVIAQARNGSCSIGQLMEKLLESELYISSRTEVEQDGAGFEPLLLGESDSPLMAVFSSLSRPVLHRKMAEYVLKMRGREFFQRLPAGYGVVLNPGYESQFIVASDVASQMKTA